MNRTCRICLKNEMEVEFTDSATNLCKEHSKTYYKLKMKAEKKHMTANQEVKELIYAKKRNQVKQGLHPRDIIQEAENDLEALDHAYDNLISHGVVPDYGFKVIPRTAADAMIVSDFEELTTEDLIQSFTERNICGFGSSA